MKTIPRVLKDRFFRNEIKKPRKTSSSEIATNPNPMLKSKNLKKMVGGIGYQKNVSSGKKTRIFPPKKSTTKIPKHKRKIVPHQKVFLGNLKRFQSSAVYPFKKQKSKHTINTKIRVPKSTAKILKKSPE